VIDYLAACANNDCSTVDKTALKFAKIDQVGLHNGPAPGNWAVNDLVNNNNSWVVTVPSSLKAGAYVLRHEIVSLHAARSDNGAQNYPQCVNLSKFIMTITSLLRFFWRTMCF
jgi:cellulase